MTGRRRNILVHGTTGLRSSELRRGARDVINVGVWDLGAWLGSLPDLLSGLTSAQSKFLFVEVKAMVPAGLIGRPERTAKWARSRLGRRLYAAERKVLESNLVADDFYFIADPIRQDLGLDYLVGVTPSMVAGEDGRKVFWNHFSAFSGRCILTSTFDLRKFAAETSAPFDVFLGGIIVAELLVALFYPRLGFHREDRGCLFDYNESRVSIKDKIHSVTIDEECMQAIGKSYRPAARRLVKFLQQLGRTGTP